MSHIEIRDVGPVRQVSLDLLRFNVFIGRQSSGKSTIAKIISNCMWMEKEVLTHPQHYGDLHEFEERFIKGLEDFHFMHGYFSSQSFISYQSEYLSITYQKEICSIVLTKKRTFERCKVLYIPAERNIAVKKFPQTQDNNMRSFSIDFTTARYFYHAKNKLGLFDLGVKYYQVVKNGDVIDNIISDHGQYNITLDNASSGLQSVVPLTLTLDFYSNLFYKKDNESRTLDQWQDDDRKSTRMFIKQHFQGKAAENLAERLLKTHGSNFVIEEPELNLFPSTQKELVGFIVRSCGVSSRAKKHTCTITTHSPYILSSLNLLIFAGKLSSVVPAEEARQVTGGLHVDPCEIGVYSVNDGTVASIIDASTGLIHQNHLDEASTLISDDFNKLYRRYIQSMRK